MFKFIFIFFAVIFTNVSYSKIITINFSVAEKKFTPEYVEANIGDTINFKSSKPMLQQDSAYITVIPRVDGAVPFSGILNFTKQSFTYVCRVYENYPLTNFYIPEMKGTLKVLRPLKQAWIYVWGSYEQFRNVGNEYFVGDTVIWMPHPTLERQGPVGSHTITSTKVPTTALPFDGLYNSKNAIFKYIITTPGEYKYHCTPHAHQMTGSFTAESPTASPKKDLIQDLISAYPNPFKEIVNLENLNSKAEYKVEVYSALGNSLYSSSISFKLNEILDLNFLDSGYYILKLISGDKEKSFKIVKY